MRIWYATREDVKTALDVAETARSNAQVDRALSAASDAVEGLCHRQFYPEIRSVTWDFPDGQYGRPWRLWLNQNELISLMSLTSGGVTIPNADVMLRPDWGPPFTHIEIDLSSQSALASGSTHQRAITALGLFAYRNDEEPAGALAEVLDDVETSVDVTDSSLVGVGQLIRVDTERMVVTGRRMLSTGQTLQNPMAASVADVTVAVTNGAAYAVGEVLLLDSERMRIVDAAGNNLTVKRAWDGTVLATHTGSTIYAPRSLTVVRGALGTTAATHTLAAPVVKWVSPGLVHELAIGEALNTLLQEGTGYARPSARQGQSGNVQKIPAYGVGLDALRDQVYASYGRKARKRAV